MNLHTPSSRSSRSRDSDIRIEVDGLNGEGNLVMNVHPDLELPKNILLRVLGNFVIPSVIKIQDELDPSIP